MKNIVITGNIGAGKTTLVNKLQKLLPECHIFNEPVDENPYIDNFYKDMTKYSLSMQLFLHYFRLTQQYKIDEFKYHHYIIQDRYLYDQLVFSKVMYNSKVMSEKDFNLFNNIFNDTFKLGKEVDILIYLKVSPHVLMERIKQRNRECEKDITPDYIVMLNEEYNNVFNKGVLPNVKQQYVINYDNPELCFDEILDCIYGDTDKQAVNIN